MIKVDILYNNIAIYLNISDISKANANKIDLKKLDKN